MTTQTTAVSESVVQRLPLRSISTSNSGARRIEASHRPESGLDTPDG